MNQHKVDIAAKFAEEAEPVQAVLSEPAPVSNNTMSADEIEALLLKSGLSDLSVPDEKPEPVEEKSSGGMMSQADIEAMLAAASAPEPVSEPAPVEEKTASGGKMSQDDIEKMLAAASGAVEDVAGTVQETLEAAAPEPAAEPAPVEEKPASGGKMSQADIEALLNGMQEDATT